MIPDTGKRSEFGTGAVRDASEGKGWPSSIPPEFIRSVAKRFEDGGKKYGEKDFLINFFQLLVFLCNCNWKDYELCQKSLQRLENIIRKQHAILRDATPQKVCAFSVTLKNVQKLHGRNAIPTEWTSETVSADLVTIKNLKTEILNITNGKMTIASNGQKKTLKKLEKLLEISEIEIKKNCDNAPEKSYCLNMESTRQTKKQLSQSKAEDVAFAELPKQPAARPLPFKSIMITPLVSLGDFYAVDAIKAWDCWEILLVGLKELWNTSKTPPQLRLSKSKDDLVLTLGDKKNWQKGIPLTRYIDSMMRHLLQLAEGDASEDHIGAIGWNAAAFQWTKEQILLDRLASDLYDLPYDVSEAKRWAENGTIPF